MVWFGFMFLVSLWVFVRLIVDELLSNRFLCFVMLKIRGKVFVFGMVYGWLIFMFFMIMVEWLRLIFLVMELLLVVLVVLFLKR